MHTPHATAGLSQDWEAAPAHRLQRQAAAPPEHGPHLPSSSTSLASGLQQTLHMRLHAKRLHQSRVQGTIHGQGAACAFYSSSCKVMQGLAHASHTPPTLARDCLGRQARVHLGRPCCIGPHLQAIGRPQRPHKGKVRTQMVRHAEVAQAVFYASRGPRCAPSWPPMLVLTQLAFFRTLGPQLAAPLGLASAAEDCCFKDGRPFLCPTQGAAGTPHPPCSRIWTEAIKTQHSKATGGAPLRWSLNGGLLAAAVCAWAGCGGNVDWEERQPGAECAPLARGASCLRRPLAQWHTRWWCSRGRAGVTPELPCPRRDQVAREGKGAVVRRHIEGVRGSYIRGCCASSGARLWGAR